MAICTPLDRPTCRQHLCRGGPLVGSSCKAPPLKRFDGRSVFTNKPDSL